MKNMQVKVAVNKHEKGFTLIEFMIVVVIVAILAAVAIPSYQNSIQKTRRADAKESLTRIAAAQERYFFTNNGYATDLTKLGLAASGESSEGHYTISLGDPADPLTGIKAISKVKCSSGSSEFPCFALNAVPKGVQDDDSQCAIFQVYHTGKKVAKGGSDGKTDTTKDCW